jgi:ABC-type transport system involved in multi-copper enzyme maturation permease subunit
VFLGLSALVASVFRKGPRALGAALFVWFFFVGFYDLLVIGGSFLVRERTANTLLFVSLFGNPVDMVRTASLMALDGREVFGPAGAALVRYFGGIHAALIWLLGALGLWIVVPLVLSRRVLERQDF